MSAFTRAASLRRFWTVLLCSTLAISGFAVRAPKAQATDPTVVSFIYTGASQTWTVPSGVSSIQVDAWGAQGGDPNYGGLGGHVTATIPVTPAESIQINVGGQAV